MTESVLVKDLKKNGSNEPSPKISQQEIKVQVDDAWNSLIEVLATNPKKAISDFIEYSKSSDINRFGWFNQFTIYLFSKGKARYVRTANYWEKLGRKVKKGASSYPIFVVIPAWKDKKGIIRGPSYRMFTEYDVADTEGEYIPEPREIPAKPHAARRLWCSLKGYCEEEGLILVDEPFSSSPLLEEAMGGTNGKIIYVQPDLPLTQKVRVLAHEIAHVHMHISKYIAKPFVEPRNGYPPDMSIKELEADSVACLVCAAWGIDVTEHSKYYFMIYTDGNIRPQRISERVFQTTRQILAVCDPKGKRRRENKNKN